MRNRGIARSVKVRINSTCSGARVERRNIDGQTQSMISRQLCTHWLLGTVLGSLLGIATGSCSDDGKSDTSAPSASSSSGSAATGTAGAKAGGASSDPALCPDKVYAALSDGCKTCACGVDPQLAPSCQKPCWDFLACSVRAQTGKCASFAAGGMAMRPQFEACTMEECGAELAVPGAEVVSSYRSIIGACAVSMGGAKAACEDDVAKFISELAP
jgi:hypothetical protein